MPVSTTIHAVVQRGIESFELDVNGHIGDRCDYGMLAHCTDPTTGEHYVASCSEPDETPEVFLFQPLTPESITVEDTEFDDDPEEEFGEDGEGEGEGEGEDPAA